MVRTLNDIPYVPGADNTVDTVTVKLAHCMWKDGKVGEVYEADLFRVCDNEGKVHWEVDRTVTPINPEDGDQPTVEHFEFDNFEEAVEHYGDAVQITIYAS